MSNAWIWLLQDSTKALPPAIAKDLYRADRTKLGTSVAWRYSARNAARCPLSPSPPHVRMGQNGAQHQRPCRRQSGPAQFMRQDWRAGAVLSVTGITPYLLLLEGGPCIKPGHEGEHGQPSDHIGCVAPALTVLPEDGKDAVQDPGDS